MKRPVSSGLCTLVLILICVLTPPQANATNFLIQGTSGVTISPGEVGDNLIGGGFLLGGRLGLALNNRINLFAGSQFSIFGGADVNGVELTDGALLFTVEGGGSFYLVNGQISDIRPYLAGAVGLGGLGWSYTPAAQQAFGVDSDGVGLFFLVPEVGVEFGLGDNLALGVGTKFYITGYSDNTTEDFSWDFKDGHYWQFFGTLTVEL